MICSPAGPPGSQGPGPCQVGRTSLRNDLHGSCLTLFGLLCGIVPRLRSPFRGGVSRLHRPSGGSASGGGSYTSPSPFRGSASCFHWPSCGCALSSRLVCHGVSTSCPRPALSCAQDTHALGLAVAAFSVSPAGSTPAVPSAKAGAAPATGNAPLVRRRHCQRVRLHTWQRLWPRQQAREERCLH